ncbi:MAG: hypothetical protein Q9N34_06440 [Aquificota bacterium]|nr:hypothetical protein [Aquificota bacterium]
MLEDLQRNGGGGGFDAPRLPMPREHGIDGFTVVYTIIYREG